MGIYYSYRRPQRMQSAIPPLILLSIEPIFWPPVQTSFAPISLARNDNCHNLLLPCILNLNLHHIFTAGPMHYTMISLDMDFTAMCLPIEMSLTSLNSPKYLSMLGFNEIIAKNACALTFVHNPSLCNNRLEGNPSMRNLKNILLRIWFIVDCTSGLELK